MDVAETVIARCFENRVVGGSGDDGIFDDISVAAAGCQDLRAGVHALVSKEDVLEVTARGACFGCLGGALRTRKEERS